MLSVYTRLGMLTAGDATGGSTTTIVDSALGGSDDDWRGGGGFVIRDAGGGRAGPPAQGAYQGRTGDANDNRWIPIRDWKYIPAAAGSTGLLVLPQLPVGRDIRIVYDGIHPVVNAFSDKINELIAEDVVVAEACYHALLWLAGREQYTNPGRIQSLNQATQEREIARARHPIWRPPRPRQVNILRNYVDPDEFTVPQP